MKFLQKQRERKSGIPALTTALQSGAAVGDGGGGGGGLTKISKKNDGDAEKDDWFSKIPSLKKPLFWLKIPIYKHSFLFFSIFSQIWCCYFKYCFLGTFCTVF